MRLNRDLQREVLQQLRQTYPEATIIKDIESPLIQASFAELGAVASYLCEHGLIGTESGHAQTAAWYLSDVPMKITARGLDFLEQDGGLSAILGTVTVKLHADTIKDMLESRILSAELPPEEKKRFVDTLRELPGETLKTFTNKLVEMACDNPQAVVTALSRLVP